MISGFPRGINILRNHKKCPLLSICSIPIVIGFADSLVDPAYCILSSPYFVSQTRRLSFSILVIIMLMVLLLHVWFFF
ncbi:hypothetical protein RIF29_28195 [Crotalaria pallida]|uniref:Uncharacterized protein n=1 Tax=Crotalaria pallida TaxID=3830 RepID=A0AAN9EQI9_CROPI